MPARGELASVKGQALWGREWGRDSDDGQCQGHTWARIAQLCTALASI